MKQNDTDHIVFFFFCFFFFDAVLPAISFAIIYGLLCCRIGPVPVIRAINQSELHLTLCAMDFLKQHLNNATEHLEAKSTNKKRVNKTTESAGSVSKKQKVHADPQHQFNHMIAAKKVVLEEEKKRGKTSHHVPSHASSTHIAVIRSPTV